MSASKSRMERILRLFEEIDALKADIRDVYAEEKDDGGDKTAMGAAIAIIRKRAKIGAAEFDTRDALVDGYLNHFDGPPRAHTHVPAHTREAA